MTDESPDLPYNKAGLDKSFSKGLILLRHLATCEAPAGISDLSAALGMTKSNVHRLLQTLAAYGFVHKNAKSRYSPSLRYWEMGYEVWLHSRAGQVALNDADGLALKANCLVHITLAAEESQELILYDRIGTPIAHPMRFPSCTNDCPNLPGHRSTMWPGDVHAALCITSDRRLL